MAQIQTQLVDFDGNKLFWIDTLQDVDAWVAIEIQNGIAVKRLLDHITKELISTETTALISNIATFNNGDSFNSQTGIYTFADGQPNVFQSANLTPQSTDVDTAMGVNYYEEDLTTNVKKYFAESFKFDGSQFEMDGDRIVGLKQSFIDTLAVDLTNIVNTSITTASLTADTATINQTLTALGINTDLLKTKDLRLVDGQGHEHKLHLGN